MHDHEHDRRQGDGPVRRRTDRHEEVSNPFAPGRPHDAGSVLHLQRTAGNAAVTEMLQRDEESPVHSVVSGGGGQALDPRARAKMESAFGADFSSVKVHTDAAASDSAKSVQAHAYTVGENVVFQSGRYQPGSASGERMLAHELTHVVQQRSGPVDGTPASGGIKVSDPSDRYEREAEQTADRVMSSTSAAPTTGAPAGSVQRAAEVGDEETEEMDAAVQRAAVPGEEETEEL